jgi:hypothetical protein
MPGRFSLIVDPLIQMTRLTKALMGGGSGHNLMYLNTFKGLGLTLDQLQSSPHPFYGVVPGKKSVPLGRVTLPVTFRDVSNCHAETLAFEVVDFSGPYHIIPGRPCYMKFMAITSYAYLKLKIPRPASIITVEAKTQRALDCEQNSIELAAAVVVMTELRKLCLWVPPALTDPTMPSSSSAIKMVKDTKDVLINIEDPSKTIQIGMGLDPK